MKRLLLIILDLLGINRLAAFLRRHEIIILRYHEVVDAASAAGPTTHFSSAAFERQLRVLRRRYNIVSLEEALRMIKGEQPVRPYSVVLTFDDGYRNNATVAYPLLKKYGATATFFVTTRFVDERIPLWFDRLYYALANMPPGRLSVMVDGVQREFALATPDERERTRAELNRICKLAGVQRSEPLVDQIERVGGRRLADVLEQDEVSAPMTWEQIRQVASAGIEVGSHTVNHEVLGRIDRAGLVAELTESRRTLEERLGRPCRLFCYPNGQPGDFNDVTRGEVIAAGHSCALTTVYGTARRGDDPYTLKRISAAKLTDPYRFLAELSGLATMLLRMRDWTRRRRPATAGALADTVSVS